MPRVQKYEALNLKYIETFKDYPIDLDKDEIYKSHKYNYIYRGYRWKILGNNDIDKEYLIENNVNRSEMEVYFNSKYR